MNSRMTPGVNNSINNNINDSIISMLRGSLVVILLGLLLFPVSFFGQGALPSSVTKSNYTLESGESEVLQAGQSIRILPNSWIKSGSSFRASIVSQDPLYVAGVPSSSENYVCTRRYRRGLTSASNITYQGDVVESIVYFDGLGRGMQQIGINQGSAHEDIITHVGYDAYGRQDKEYLPYASSSGTAGSYRSSGVVVNLENYYFNRYGDDFSGMSNSTSQVDGLPVYSEKHLESSPLSRVLEQGAPGKSWQVNKNSDSDHTIKFEYQSNTSSDGVRLYRVDLSGALPVLVLNTNASYPAGELYKTVTKDENWTPVDGSAHTTEEFTDKQGRVVLKRTYGDSDSNGGVATFTRT